MGSVIGTRMVADGRTAREVFEDSGAIRCARGSVRFGFGRKLAVVSVDLQRAYTCIDEFKTAYETDSDQIHHINAISWLTRRKGMPVVWTRVAYHADAFRCRRLGNSTLDTRQPAEHQIWISPARIRSPVRDRRGSRCGIHQTNAVGLFEVPFASLLVWHGVDTVVVTGGSTSGCVRATAVDALSRGYRTIVLIETCADKHESYHFANLTDLQLKYADVEPVRTVMEWLEQRPDA